MIRTLAALLAASTCIVALATPAAAQTREYKIPAGSLKSALDAYVRQSGRQVVYRADEVRSARSPGVLGQQSAEAALAALLIGSGFVTRADGDMIAIVKSSGNAPAATDKVGSFENAAESEIVVTGSRIRGARPTSPVISSSREKISELGYTDLGSYVRSIAQNFNGGQNPGVISSIQTGSENTTSSSTLNLRGLGPDATLTLLNGHRLAYDAVSQGIDISAIPLAAIERIEIVADGSSALYGSDAVGGVANILLRRDFDGLEASARFGGATDGGDVQQQYSAVTGQRWSSGGFMIAGDFNKATDIAASQRSYTANVQPSLTLLPSQRQISAVAAGHQQLADAIELEIDAHYNSHRSFSALPFTGTADVTQSGITSSPEIESYSISPAVKFRLPGGWEFAARATRALSDSRIISTNYAAGIASANNHVRYKNDLWSAEMSAEGPIAELPGGEARLAFGGGLRSNGLIASIRRVTPTLTTTPLNYTDSQTATFAYGEVALPLVSDRNAMPFISKLQLSGALRYERYDNFGGLATPKIGLLYQPIGDLTLKGAWGKSFKAPTLSQLNTVQQGVLNPPSRYIPAPGASGNVLQLSGGSKALEPEKATTLTLGAEFAPLAIPGLRLEASYFTVRYKNRVVRPIADTSQAFKTEYADLILLSPSLAQVLAATADLPLGVTNQTGAAYDPASVGAIIYNRLQNAALQHIKGVDTSASYKFSTGGHEFDLEAHASYLDSDQKLSASQPTIERAGTIFSPPHWRGSASASWRRASVGATLAYNYVGGNDDNRTTTTYRIRSFSTVDATISWRPEGLGLWSGWSFLLSGQNILNEKPPLIRTSSAASPTYDATNYSAIGRLVSLTVSKNW
jgi:outer membrane receptor protein involved in Fe transport